MSTEEQVVKTAPASAADDKAAPSQDDKSVPYSRFKEINDRAKAAETALKAREDADKAAAEKKAIEEGKLQEVLADKEAKLKALVEKAESYEKQEKKLRKGLIEKITDKDLQSIAEDIHDIDKLQLFVDKHTKDTTPPNSSRGPTPDAKVAASEAIRDFKGSPGQLVAMLKKAGFPVE